MTSTAHAYPIQGERVTLPVRIRDAAVGSAMFAVPAGAAQAVIAYSGLEVAEPLPGKAICSLAFVRYADGDLGPYHEFAVAFLVRPPGGTGSAGVLGRLRGIGAFIHWLPVNQEFTLEAGRTIWGFPKEIADIPMDLAGRVLRCAVRFGGRTAIEVAVRPGIPMPDAAGAPSMDAYSCLDGVTRRTPWTLTPSRVRTRPGGAKVVLGDHPVAEELRGLGLDRARALSSSTVGHLRMVFQAAEEVRA
ncbi:acetoacetate decarboxylase family protein [Actinomadura madurae]|uniref:acetoacetate decarboxylase family protein n=1 Tax=Actinomadura madurae TaxID=1993 RepID=UPI00202693FF|nr:acetoacetate decarboxylase family protein [Actinomadura madurae]MCP9950584.1 acetoacetate decarboxylase family protein [Actinomadura madurae]MCP9967361.1 acetoacetate decarboxylase family protein [Actinomadura madurae]MCP9979824.1 acetoacetate decarboxylase family protein [Actinomadura madurae]MCQ0008647.1 acetoacetate decarboxylase family protein [Actinomadura madurae]MCQ0016027.1 acetoacetate decarboxylase family protein [Actinomadura madurae]